MAVSFAEGLEGKTDTAAEIAEKNFENLYK